MKYLIAVNAILWLGLLGYLARVTPAEARLSAKIWAAAFATLIVGIAAAVACGSQPAAIQTAIAAGYAIGGLICCAAVLTAVDRRLTDDGDGNSSLET